MGCFPGKVKGPDSSSSHKKSTQGLQPSAELRIEASSFKGRRTGQVQEVYEWGEQLGTGALGYVTVATHMRTQHRRAIKTLLKAQIAAQATDRVKFFSDIDAFKQIDHPNIVKLYEFYEDETSYHLVTEYVDGKPLSELNRQACSEQHAAQLIQQVLSAIAYSHSLGIIHHDLKPENLLVNTLEPGGTVKIINYCTASAFGHPRIGSVCCIAPEALAQESSEKCDVWSCGVILFLLLSGKVPFPGRSERDVVRRVQKGEYSMKGPEWNKVSPGAKRLVNKMLEYNFRTRISASEAVQDEWIISNTQSQLASQGLAVESLKNLGNFYAEQQLQHAVLTFIASQLVSQEDEGGLIQVFLAIDKNGDGKLSHDELVEAYAQQMDLPAAVEHVNQIMARVDVNNSGYIDYTEFIMASTKREALLSHRNLEAAFKSFDCDDSGKISAEELKEVFGSAEDSSVEQLWQGLIQDVDDNGDGEIDLPEFKAMMFKLFQPPQLNSNSC